MICRTISRCMRQFSAYRCWRSGVMGIRWYDNQRSTIVQCPHVLHQSVGLAKRYRPTLLILSSPSNVIRAPSREHPNVQHTLVSLSKITTPSMEVRCSQPNNWWTFLYCFHYTLRCAQWIKYSLVAHAPAPGVDMSHRLDDRSGPNTVVAMKERSLHCGPAAKIAATGSRNGICNNFDESHI